MNSQAKRMIISLVRTCCGATEPVASCRGRSSGQSVVDCVDEVARRRSRFLAPLSCARLVHINELRRWPVSEPSQPVTINSGCACRKLNSCNHLRAHLSRLNPLTSTECGLPAQMNALEPARAPTLRHSYARALAWASRGGAALGRARLGRARLGRA